MKVLHVLYNYVPDKTGSTTRSRGLLSGQVVNGLEVLAVTSPFQGGVETDYGTELIDHVTVHRTKRDGRLTIDETYKGFLYRIRKMLTVLKFSRDIRGLVKRHAVDVVHAHSNLYCFLAARLGTAGLKTPVVYEVRSLWFERFKNAGIVSRMSAWSIACIEVWCARAAAHVYVINDGLSKYLIGRGIAASRVTVVPNAVSDNVLRVGATIQQKDEACPIAFGYAGNLSSIEGLEDLIDAFVEEFVPDENVRLVLWGRGPHREQVLEHIGGRADPRIELRGEFTQADLRDVYGSIDAFVLPRRRSILTETVTPLKPLEALAFGKKLLLSTVGGHAEVVDGLADVEWFEPGDVHSLRQALRKSLDSASCWRTESFANAMKEYVRKNKAWSSIADKYRESYEGVVRGC